MDIIEKRQEVLQYCENINRKNTDIQNSDNHVLIKKCLSKFSRGQAILKTYAK